LPPESHPVLFLSTIAFIAGPPQTPSQFATSGKPFGEKEFWNDSLEIESSQEGIVSLVRAMIYDPEQQLWDSTALEIEASKVQSILAERIATFELERDGWELRKALRFPLRGISIPFATGILPKFVTLFLVFTFGNRLSKALEKTL
jgi:hypothetical protein